LNFNIKKYTRTGLFLVFSLTFCATTLSAQVNTERMRSAHDKAGYMASAGMDFNVLAGNSEKFELAPNARLDYVGDYWSWFLVGNYKYGESAQTAFANKGFLHWRVTAPLHSDGLSWEFFVQREFDEFRRITDRSLFGLSLRTALLDKGPAVDGGDVYLGSGLMSEHEAYQSSDPSDLIRWTNYLSAGYTQKSFRIVAIVYLQPALSDFGNLRALADTSMNFYLTDQVSWRFSVKGAYTSRPQVSVKSYDVDIQNGISWSF
jgi:hypothetical protein